MVPEFEMIEQLARKYLLFTLCVCTIINRSISLIRKFELNIGINYIPNNTYHMTHLNSIVVRVFDHHAGDCGSIPRRGRFYNHRMFSLSIHKRADAKYKFQYYISFFIDSVVVSVLVRYAGDHGSIHGQVAFLVTEQSDVKYNLRYI